MKPFDVSIVQRLQRFGTYGKLKQAALKKVASFVAQDPTLFKGTTFFRIVVYQLL